MKLLYQSLIGLDKNRSVQTVGDAVEAFSNPFQSVVHTTGKDDGFYIIIFTGIQDSLYSRDQDGIVKLKRNTEIDGQITRTDKNTVNTRYRRNFFYLFQSFFCFALRDQLATTVAFFHVKENILRPTVRTPA